MAVSAISPPSGSRRQRASVSKVQRPIRSAGRGGGGGLGGAAARPRRGGAATARMRARSSRGSNGLTT